MESTARDAFESTLDRTEDLRRGSLISDRVYALTRKAIINGELKPGQRVVESDIARRLDVSQSPVRDAMNRLAHEGLLTHVPRRGNFVTQISEEEERQARDVRVALEELAARLAAKQATVEELEELEGLVVELQGASRRNDLAEFRNYDIAFHAGVCEASHNIFLIRLWRTMEPSWRSLHAVADPLFEGDWEAMANEHGRLLQILRAGDPKKAATAFARHADRHGPVQDQNRSRRR